MILSVCPNPCVDCTIELDLLKVGGLNRIENKIITYSGKALNVAIGVSRLGGDSFATGFMFDDNGKMFVHALDDENVKNTFVWNKGSARTNYKIVDKRSMMTEINDKGENISPENQAELVSLVGELSKSASVVVMSGSLPGGVGVSDYLFMDLFGNFVPDPAELDLLSRGISFYSCILLCARWPCSFRWRSGREEEGSTHDRFF